MEEEFLYIEAARKEMPEDLVKAFHTLLFYIVQLTPPGRAQSIAKTRLEECFLWSEKAIVGKGKV